MPISPARLAAFRALTLLQLEGTIPTDVMNSDLAGPLSVKDQSLATELVYGVLRRQLQLDWAVSRYCRIALGKLDLPVLLALRLGAYQLLCLSRIPARAAVHESVELVKRANLRSAAGIVNAVLRRLDREDFQIALGSLDHHSDEGMSILYSHPAWLVARWRKQLGEGAATCLLKTNNLSPPTFFRMNSPLDPKKALEEMARQGVTCQPHPLIDGCWKVVDGTLLKTNPYQDGRIYIQDPASQLVPFFLDAMSGHSCLDVCAAPGGKLSQIARLTGGGAFLVGMDLRWLRLRSMARLHLKNWPGLCLVVANGKEELPFSIKFDRILVDAPCSGTATLQRNPDIRWSLSPVDFQRLQIAQLTILENAAQQLKPDGTMVYSTCSLEQEENEDVVELFLGRHLEFCLGLPQDLRLQQRCTSGGFFKLLPSEWNSDGVFAAILKRRGSAG